MVMESGEVFAWIIFMIVITVLFFAAFGGSEYNEQSIEEYMNKLTSEEKRRKM
jgi:hypothetical protein|tara:strand:+ start:96 stop:254 length:159 start_codon:yes stop_codon:yes gene_type:complete